MPKLHQTLFTLGFAGVASMLAPLVTAQQARPQGPCDIYAAAGTPCVTAHSTVRSLSSRYGGPLYQVKRADGRLVDIGVIPGGFADAAAPCANGSASPDHVVLTVLSWRPPCCATQAEWETQVGKAVATLRSKYAGLKRIDLMTVVRGPRNQGCPAPPAADEYIAMPQEFDAALAGVAARFPGQVFVGPKVEAPSCASFVGGGPHLTREGNAEVAKAIAAYFVNHQ